MSAPGTATEHLRGEIETRRAAQGLSLSELERRAGLGKGTVAKFLKDASGGRELSIDVIERLAPVLGTSLTYLLGGEPAAATPPTPLRMLRADQIFPSPLNPRKTTALDAASISDLARSVAANGILQNLTARPRPNPLTDTPQVEIVMGERRWRAVVHAIEQGDLPHDFELPVVVRDLSDAELIELAMIENISRADMSPLEEAEGLAVLHDTARLSGGRDWTARLAKATGKTDRWVQKRVRLARELSDAGKAALAKGEISLQMALELSEVPHAAQGVVLTAIAAKSWGWDNAEKVQQKLFESLPLASQAIFDLAQYDGGTIEKDGVVKLADPAQAERLQLAAIAAEFQRRDIAGENPLKITDGWNWRPAETGETGQTLLVRDGFAVRWLENHAQRGSGRVSVNPDAEARAQAEAAASQARKAARHAFLAETAAHLRGDPATRLRLQILNTLRGVETGLPAPIGISHTAAIELAQGMGLTGDLWAGWDGDPWDLTDERLAAVEAALAAIGQSKLERLLLEAALWVGPAEVQYSAWADDEETALSRATGIPLPAELIEPQPDIPPDGDKGDDEDAIEEDGQP